MKNPSHLQCEAQMLADTVPFCSPPPKNDKAVSVPADTKSGEGVCTHRRCPSCGNSITSDRTYCALSFCAAYDAVRHAAENKKPIGQSNLDSTRTKIVRKGCKVRFDGGLNGYVIKVRMGQCWAKGAISGMHFYLPCSEVRVIN